MNIDRWGPSMAHEQATSSISRRLPPHFLHEMRLWMPFITISLAFISAVAVVAGGYGLYGQLHLTTYNALMAFSIALTALLAIIGYVLFLGFGERERRPLERIGRDLRAHILTPDGFAGLATPLLLIPFFVGAFSSFKAMIPILNPFHLDPIFESLDRFLHFGFAPWEITHFLFRGEALNLLFQMAYNSWFLIMWVFMLGHICWLKGQAARARYLLAFILCWLAIGSVFAFLLSSAGPCYYGRVYDGPDPYAPLMQHLQALNQPMVDAGQYWSLWSLWVQDMLWQNYTHSLSALGSGISAMPSMHVSIAVLMALGAYQFSTLIGRIMSVYAVLIMIGSVHLGWHYAVDGYLAAALTFAIWHLSGWMIGKASGAVRMPQRLS